MFDGPMGPRYFPRVHDKDGPNPREDAEGGRAERLLPELLKRLVESIDRFSEGKDMRQRVGELKLPKEVLALLLSQLEESKNGLYRALAKELRDFLEQTNFADELIAALTKLTFEIKTEVRFVPSSRAPAEAVKPDVRAEVRVKREPSASAQNAEQTKAQQTAPKPSSERSSTPPSRPRKED